MIVRTSYFCLGFFLVARVFVGVDAAAQVPAKQTAPDYGAETVDDTDKVSALAVPVELVEDRDGENKKNDKPEAAPAAGVTAEAAPLPPELGKFTPLNDNDDLDEETTKLLNANELDLEVLVNAISRLTRRNYIVDSSVKGKVTIHLPQKVKLTEALRIFDSVLHLKGFTTVPIGDNLYKVVLGKDAQKTTIPLLLEPPKKPTDRLVTELLRLKHVQAEDIQKILAQFISKDGLINTVSGTNAIIIIDSAANIARLRDLVQQVDIPASDQDITIVPILHAEAKDIADKVNEILGEKSKEGTQSTRLVPRTPIFPGRFPTEQPPQPTFTPPSFTPASGISRQALPLKIIPDERTNSVIVVADPTMTAKVRALIEQLDSEFDQSGGRFYVYALKHADAEELADILNGAISGGGGGGGGSRDTSEKSTKRGTSSTQGSSLTRSSRETSERQASPGDRLSRALSSRSFFSFPGATSQSEGKVNFEGEVSIAADPATNSLIINAARSDYLKIKELIDQLDVKRQQVLVEATLLEVTLEKSSNLGMTLQASGGGNDGGLIAQSAFAPTFFDLIGKGSSTAQASALQDFTIAAASTGTITLPGSIVIPSQSAILHALSANKNVNVLSAPTILTMDNVEAEIIVGENRPFITSKGTDPTNLNNTFNQVERQDIGIKLRITPQIGMGDFVTLKIFVEVSDLIEGTDTSANGPSTTIRTSDTTVEVKSNQMIITGGLMKDKNGDAESGIPYLKDIPVLGNLFKQAVSGHVRTNLLIFITPRILTDHYDAREATIEARNTMEGAIVEQGVQPDRSDILHRKQIDQVAEEIPPPGVLPTPITPPTTRKLSDEEKAAIGRTNARLQALIGRETAKTETDDDVISVTVKPKLPGESSAPRATNERRQATAGAAKSVYVVLRALDGPNSAAGARGVTMLGTLGSPNARFFRAGDRYTYAGQSQEQHFVCLGVYASRDEATVIHPELKESSRWAALPTEEVFSLGKGPWQKTNNSEISSTVSKK